MEFRILGPLEVAGTTAADSSATPRAAKLRVVLGVLLVRANEVVPAASLIDELWGDNPPRTATTTLQVYVSQLRKMLVSANPVGARQSLVTRPPGYLLQLEPGQLDRITFEDLYERGSQAMEQQDYVAAADLHQRALALWRGDFLAGTPHGPLLDRTAVLLAEQRMAALEQRVRADLRLGRHHGLIGELQSATAEHPLREELHAHLMVSLYRCGRQGDALRAFARARRTLVEELAVEPGPALQRLQQRILVRDPVLLHPPGTARPAAPAPVTARMPVLNADSLPAADPAFTGRTAQLAEIEALLRNAPARSGVLITGQCGIGKTALAVEAAHRTGDVFPDGRVYLDLHPGRPLSAEDAMAQLLRRCGVPDPLPSDAEDLRDVVGRLLAGRQVLLVLDNASSAAQVRPLLPTAPGSVALITARRPHPGLSAVSCVILGTLDPQESQALFDTVAGRPADDSGRAAVAEIAAACGHLPLAVRIAAVQLATHPHWTALSLAARLHDEHSRLSALHVGDLDIRVSLTAAYRESSSAEQRAFRLLSLIPPGYFGLWLAAAVLGVPADLAERRVERLVDAHLMEAGPDNRYRLTGLLRLLAAECRGEEEPEESVRSAIARICGAYAEVAEYADARLTPGRIRHAADPGDTAWAAHVVGGHPLHWFETHQPALVQAAAQAHQERLWEPVLRLVNSTAGFLEACAAWDDWATTQHLALDAARRLGDRSQEAGALRSLGDLAWQQRQLDRADDLYRQARKIAEEAGDQQEIGRAQVGLADVCLDSGAVREAAALLTPALAAVTARGDVRGRYEALRGMALLALATDGKAAAEERFAECLELAESLRDRRLGAYARRAMRQVHTGSGTARDRGSMEVRPGVWRLRSRTALGGVLERS